MGAGYLFFFQPTFTQGLVVGQLSILVLLFVVFRYLFLDTSETTLDGPSSYRPRADADAVNIPNEVPQSGTESADWLNVLFFHVLNTYRSKLSNDLSGSEGDLLTRKKVEEYANTIRPKHVIDLIHIHSVDLGVSSPQFSNARSVAGHEPQTEFDVSYVDTLSVSFSTAYLLNYPMCGFARLPVSLTISLTRFACTVIVTPPTPSSSAPSFTLSVLPTFVLDLKTTSLLGSRAKLTDVPKLHELIADQIRRQIVLRSSIKIPLPGITSVSAVIEQLNRDALGVKSHD